MTPDTSEKGLETIIERSLLTDGGYLPGKNADYDKTYCLDTVHLRAFLEDTQPDTAAKLGLTNGGLSAQKFWKRLFDQITLRGLPDVLRKGVKHGDTTVRLYAPQPASESNPKAVADYARNRFSVTRQLHYSNANPGLSLDMTLFINGLPVATLELKNHFTGQDVQDAKRQYQNDRDPREPLFALARCVVHFAVDDALVFMTTHLQGPQTTFLPFNKGVGSGAGNPVNPDGLKTDYLWKQILTKDSLAGILEKYAHLTDEKDEAGRVYHRLLFPRFHQLDLVRMLLAKAQESGAGQRYLIQHSAGSGKSNSLTWLAHQLVELNGADGKTVFDTILVVTDRRNLDKQIRDNIKQFAHVAGVVEAITAGSKQLKEALEEGKKIVITTVQKFPFIVDEMGDLPGHRFAILIDEAHSSQSGDTAAKMNQALAEAKAAYDPDMSQEDRINAVISSRKMLPNASYFAFTATPKNKTLETFGVQHDDGKFYAHHIYSMKQAIEEGFILDVLQNYTTYGSYYKVLKRVDDDPEFDKVRAQKKLKQYVESHPDAIRQKAGIMVEHFLEHVLAPRKVGGRAKAMIVTNGIASAIRYKHAVDAVLRERRSSVKALVAFSGSKEVDGEMYDEYKMNGFPSVDIPDEFKKPEYRFLIVADKFQTGFDQPLLHTMYVDKPLADVQAVQTLSRLNRCHPDKTDTFVLDFVNSADVIKEAFAPYYETAILSEATDLNRLNDLQDSLDNAQVYARKDVDEFMKRFLGGADRAQLDPLLDTAAGVYQADLDGARQAAFKGDAKAFVRAYQFLASILPFSNVYWESLSTFLKFLLTKLPAPTEEDLALGILEGSVLDSYRAEKQATVKIALEGGAEIAPAPAQSGGLPPEAEMDALSRILSSFNERFGTNWTEDDKLMRVLFEDIPAAVQQDEDYQNAKQFSDKQTARIVHDKAVVNKFQEIIFDHTELYRRFTDDAQFKQQLCELLFNMDYSAMEASRPVAGTKQQA
ncbi:MAG: type I restriction endonuclease subunit R [Acidimicrobiales bacterium]